MTATATLSDQMPVVRPPKVFGVGLHKTSTTSLANALYTLGYYVGGHFDVGRFDSQSALENHVLEQAAVYDAVQDMPWPAFYRLLDERFPGSRFILTVRDPERWVASVVRHFGEQRIAAHEAFYGVPTAAGHEATYLDRYERHNQEVQEHFAGRDDLLVIDISAGAGWPELCAFLELPQPGLPFPRQNDAADVRQGRYRRAIERRVRAGAARVPLARRLASPLDAKDAYAAVQLLCQRFDALAAALDDSEPSEEIARAEGMFRTFLEHHLSWARAVVDDDDALDHVQTEIDSWDLVAAWRQLAVATRRWAADLTDYGTGLRAADGSGATPSVRACVNAGLDHWEAIAGSFGLGDFDPNPRRELARL